MGDPKISILVGCDSATFFSIIRCLSLLERGLYSARSASSTFPEGFKFYSPLKISFTMSPFEVEIGILLEQKDILHWFTPSARWGTGGQLMFEALAIPTFSR